MSTLPQQPLIDRGDLLAHGAGSDFLDGFRVRPLELQVVAGGGLGQMSVRWRLRGDERWSVPEPSSEGASTWTWSLEDPAWASVTFIDQQYVEGHTWSVGVTGLVTPQEDAPGGVSSVRQDLVTRHIAAVSSKIAEWTQPRCVPPIITLGEGQKADAAVWVIYRLKSREGLTPKEVGPGDDNWRQLAEDAERNFRAIGRSDNRPYDIVDSSPSGNGAGIPLMPTSRPRRGFGSFR